ncbi:hypothetical protein R6Q57_019178, partial [Mikania cordata]
SVGMGLLAGSMVMFLAVIWGTCIIIRKCSGVSTNIWISYSAMTMGVYVLPFIVVQFTQILHSTSGRQLAVLIGLVISIFLLAAYCIYQVYQPNIQKRRIAFANHKHVRSGILRCLKSNAFGRHVDDQGQLNGEVLYKLFSSVDVNGDGLLSKVELRSLVVGMHLNINLNEDDTVYVMNGMMKEFDTSGDDEVDFEEFITGIANWLEEARLAKTYSPIAGLDDLNYIHDYNEETKREHYLLGDEGVEDKEHGVADQDSHQTMIKIVSFLLFSTLVASIFVDPLVYDVDGFSIATSIPHFFISFIVLPLATNSSESVSSIIFASRKKQRSASLTFSEVQPWLWLLTHVCHVNSCSAMVMVVNSCLSREFMYVL